MHALGCQDSHLVSLWSRRLHRIRGVARQKLPAYGVVQRLSKETVMVENRLRRKSAVLPIGPSSLARSRVVGLNVPGPEPRELDGAEGGCQMQADDLIVALEGPGRRVALCIVLQPAL